MALNKAFKKKWVEALRSGEYKQTRGKLFNGKNSFCCLGVAANIGIHGDWEKDERGNWCINGQDMNLDPVFMEKIGLNIEEEDELIRLNDNERKTFKTIAKYIEENL